MPGIIYSSFQELAPEQQRVCCPCHMIYSFVYVILLLSSAKCINCQ